MFVCTTIYPIHPIYTPNTSTTVVAKNRSGDPLNDDDNNVGASTNKTMSKKWRRHCGNGWKSEWFNDKGAVIVYSSIIVAGTLSMRR